MVPSLLKQGNWLCFSKYSSKSGCLRSIEIRIQANMLHMSEYFHKLHNSMPKLGNSYFEPT